MGEPVDLGEIAAQRRADEQRAAAARAEQQADAATAPVQGVTVTANLYPGIGAWNIQPIVVNGEAMIVVILSTPSGLTGVYMSRDSARGFANALAQHAGGIVVAPAGTVPGTGP